MHINETSYAGDYTKSTFSKYSNGYNTRVPMVAGFNLQQANLAGIHFCDLIFPSVNFHGADFSDAMLAYAHFENCDLSQIKTDKESNLNQCVFKKCSLVDAAVITKLLCETRFYECNITNADFNMRRLDKISGFYFQDCVNAGIVKKFGH
jgi:uncharacterized protein YjbI with pentapeptide repeats